MSATTILDLTEDQQKALTKFRCSVADCIPADSDDYYLLKWLKSRKFNCEAAEEMLRKSLVWRERFGLQHVLTDWVPPLVLQQHYPEVYFGLDKEHIPVIMVPIADVDIFGLLHASTRDDFLKMNVRALEQVLGEASKISRELGRPSSIPQLFIIFDLEGLQLKDLTARTVFETIICWFRISEANYPGYLKSCTLINAPSGFPLLYSMIKPFLQESTITKIKIFSTNKQKWQPFLLQYINPDQLPVYYGGTMITSDGDPKCLSNYRLIGKVPESLYLKNIEKSTAGDVMWNTVIIRKKAKFELSYPVPSDANVWYIKWQFCTEQGSIQFAVYKIGPDKKKISILESRRIPDSSKLSPEEGTILCEKNSKYIIEFENTSILRNKKVHYMIFMEPDLKNIGEIDDNLSEEETAVI